MRPRRAALPGNSAAIVPHVAPEFQHRRADVPGPEAQGQTASTVERPWGRRLLALGAARWRLWCVTRAAVRPAEPVSAPEGTLWREHDPRPTRDDSVLGNVLVVRHDFTAPAHPGAAPVMRR